MPMEVNAEGLARQLRCEILDRDKNGRRGWLLDRGIIRSTEPGAVEFKAGNPGRALDAAQFTIVTQESDENGEVHIFKVNVVHMGQA